MYHDDHGYGEDIAAMLARPRIARAAGPGAPGTDLWEGGPTADARPAMARATTFDAHADVRCGPDDVVVVCTGRQARELAATVFTRLRFRPPWTSRTGDLQGSARLGADGVTVLVGGPGAGHAPFVERRTGGIAKLVEDVQRPGGESS